ncbi:MAG TPA: hypothetical protein DCZ40_09760 [Lachnospiraceae bacterium]|nr:hypothetical protein [Lachnospiraceae bacterium]
MEEKRNKPILFTMGPLEYDFHDIDGLYFMLDRRLSGCLVMMWDSPMNPEITGTATLDGKRINGLVNQYMEAMGRMWILGIPLRGLVTEYGREYQLHVEGFQDADGNFMTPQDFRLKSIGKEEPKPEYAEHERVALNAAREGIVLLKNENNVLPVKKGETLNLFGKGVHEFRISAVGAGKINPRYSISFVEAVRESEAYTLNEGLVEFYSCDEDCIPPEEMLQQAKKASDMAFVFLTRAAGENQDASSEKGEFYLSSEEEALLGKVSKTFAKTVVILNVGYPIDMTFVQRYRIAGLIYLGFAGMFAGKALLEILIGKVNPSGKLPDTWALDYLDIPSSRNFYDSRDGSRLDTNEEIYLDTCYEEDIYVGYRYFTTFKQKVAYPFGYGLSYTNFEICSGDIRYNGDKVKFEVHVRNVGTLSGKEVVQVYVGKPESELEQPERELCFFEKTKELLPGERQSISVQIPVHMLVSYSEEKAAYVLSKGHYRIYVGNSVQAPECGEFEVEEGRIVKQVTNLLSGSSIMKILSKKDPEHTWPEGKCSGINGSRTTFLPYQKRKHYHVEFDGQEPEKKISFEEVKKEPSRISEFVAQMSPQDLARISICASAGWGMEGIGEAGSFFQIEGYDFPYFPVSDGNSGVNLNVRNIGMPSGATICASFNKELSREIGRVIGEEAKALGIRLVLAPAFNIHRNPLNGRQPEYFSEDPYLSGIMAGFYAEGLEGAGVGSCYKHLIGNNCESARKRNQSIISERAIREIYFRTFEYAMGVHMPASVMTAYNAVNGCPTAADEELIQGLLREENGFDGLVMTDWTTYDSVDVATMVQAGNCWITPGSNDDTYTSRILEGLENGTIEIERLRENVAALVRTLVRFV